MRIKRVIKRIAGIKNKTYSQVDNYSNSGNLIHGTNCNLDGLSISIAGATNGYPNIKIGNDCFLSGNIMLHSGTAQVTIGDGVFIGNGTTFFCYESITFENDIMVSWGCTFIDTNSHSLTSNERATDVRDWLKGPEYKNWDVVKHAPILIKSKCWIGFNTIVMEGVCLGEGSVIACGSVVTKSTQPFSINGGNPAAFIKTTT
jgi:acetyltransferase-like isoleucine patch superfamily enzyme